MLQKQNSTVRGSSAQAGEQRRFARKKLLWAAIVIVRGQRHAGVIFDLSVAGARLKVDAPLAIGEEISLILMDCDALAAKVVWERRGEAGLRFLGGDDVLSQLEGRMPLTMRQLMDRKL
jgi:hypothetical protein